MKSIFDEKVFKFFKEISCIPRPSGHEKGMQDFLVRFAKERNLKYYADDFNNIIIYKKTKNCKPTILQAHLDMVCVKSPTSKVNFEKDPIKIIQSGKYLTADGTSLGADNGIGVAIILAILDSDIPCNIECLFTSCEETTMQGAFNIDTSKLSAKELICLDGFNDNTITVSSAAFYEFEACTSNETVEIQNNKNLQTFKITLSGLNGGHSGFDIDKNHGSSHKLLGGLLSTLSDIYLIDFYGGLSYNVIPSNSTAIFSTTISQKDLEKNISKFLKTYKKSFKTLKISLEKLPLETKVLKDSSKILDFINTCKHGVISKEENSVMSSINLSEINAKKGYMLVGIRCNKPTLEKPLLSELFSLCKKYGFAGRTHDVNPLFNTKENSEMLQKLITLSKKPKLEKVHFTVECGIFQDRIKDLDVVILSPKIIGAHSTDEKVEISSVLNTLNWVKKYLESI